MKADRRVNERTWRSKNNNFISRSHYQCHLITHDTWSWQRACLLLLLNNQAKAIYWITDVTFLPHLSVTPWAECDELCIHHLRWVQIRAYNDKTNKLWAEDTLQTEKLLLTASIQCLTANQKCWHNNSRFPLSIFFSPSHLNLSYKFQVRSRSVSTWWFHELFFPSHLLYQFKVPDSLWRHCFFSRCLVARSSHCHIEGSN